MKVRAACQNSKVTGVTFENVPAFAVHLDATIEVPSLGTITVDVAYGGMWYVLCKAAQVGLEIAPSQGAEIVRIGEMIKAAAREQLPVTHPREPGDERNLGPGVFGPAQPARCVDEKYGGHFDWPFRLGRPIDLDRRARPLRLRNRHLRENGSSARKGTAAASHRLRPREHSGHGLHRPADWDGAGRSVSGRRAHDHGAGGVTGIAQYLVDPTDPFPEGFMVGDIWGGISNEAANRGGKAERIDG